MNNLKITLTIVFSGILMQPLTSIARTCSDIEIGVGYFNGVNTTRRAANNSLERIQHHQINSQKLPYNNKVIYHNFYNNESNIGLIVDVAETLQQRLEEHGGYLSNRFELYWEAINGGGSWWNSIIAAVGSSSQILDGLQATAINQNINKLMLVSHVLGNQTLADHADHRAMIDQWVREQKAATFIAHSQGNLFANKAWDYAKPRLQYGLTMVHIAPASTVVHGDYLLADKDVVINALRSTGTGAVVDANVRIPAHNDTPGARDVGADFLGHGLHETYLNENLFGSIKGYGGWQDGSVGKKANDLIRRGIFNAFSIAANIPDPDQLIADSTLPCSQWRD